MVCLQELKSPDDKFLAAALHAARYGAVWHGQKSWNGVAILVWGVGRSLCRTISAGHVL
jgi:exodeoxyribonuclease III